MAGRTVLIGLDGATFSILDRMMNEGAMPFLKEFVGSGVRANLRSVVPALTPPAWTSLATGRSPGHHGVFDFFRPTEPGSKHIRMVTSQDIGCESVWSLATRHNMSSTVLNFPLTFPAPEIDGYVVPGGWMPWRQLRLGCHPQGIYDELKSLPGFNARELAMDPEQEAKAIEGCRQDEYEDWIKLHTRREQHWFEILQYLMESHPTDLTAVLFDGVDKIQHLCWRFLDPRFFRSNPDEWELRVRELCVDYFRQLDGLLRKINDLSGPDANVVIASDHGFGPSAEVFHINTWLEQNGYLAWADPDSMSGEGSETLGMGSIAKHVYELDWTRTTAYVATPSSNGVYIVPSDTGNGHDGAPREARRFRNRLMSRLRNFTDESTGQAIVSRIWSKDQVFDGPFKDLAPDLTLELRDGGLVSILPSENPLSLRTDVTGAHRSQGVFMAKGPDVREGGAVSELSIMDVTPLLVYWMGLPIPEDFEGRLPEEIFESPVQADTEEPGVRQASPSGQSRPEVSLSEEDEAVMVERLKALGYIE